MGRSLFTRRRVLLGGAVVGVVGATGGAGALTDLLADGPALRRAGLAGVVPDAPQGRVTVDRVRSAARDRTIELVIMRPFGVDHADLPVCLVLHGRGGAARGYIEFGLPRFLTAAYRAEVPPFTAVAVDCGAGYFLNHACDDPMRMLLDELPGWLAERGMPVPTAALGFSMGGWGALALARRRPDLRAVALASPALFQHWRDARKRDVFIDEQHWRAHEPLQHVADLAATPLGIWCGAEDPFAPAAREFIARAHPEIGSITPGAHDSAYWLRVLPEIMRFIGGHLAQV